MWILAEREGLLVNFLSNLTVFSYSEECLVKHCDSKVVDSSLVINFNISMLKLVFKCDINYCESIHSQNVYFNYCASGLPSSRNVFIITPERWSCSLWWPTFMTMNMSGMWRLHVGDWLYLLAWIKRWKVIA